MTCPACDDPIRHHEGRVYDGRKRPWHVDCARTLLSDTADRWADEARREKLRQMAFDLKSAHVNVRGLRAARAERDIGKRVKVFLAAIADERIK